LLTSLHKLTVHGNISRTEKWVKIVHKLSEIFTVSKKCHATFSDGTVVAIYTQFTTLTFKRTVQQSINEQTQRLNNSEKPAPQKRRTLYLGRFCSKTTYPLTSTPNINIIFIAHSEAH